MATDTSPETETTPAGANSTGTGTAQQENGSAAEATGAADTTATTDTTETTGSSDATDGTETTGGTDATAADEKATGSTATAGTAAAAGTAATRPAGPLAGAGAVVSAALGLVSLTGTSLTDMLRDREQLLGQIQAATGMPSDQIASFYGTPWHTAATVNGIFAVLAVIVGVVLFAGPAAKPGAAAWARPVALGGLVLGVLGLIVSGGMYLDLFAAQPTLPPMPSMPGMPG